MLYFFQMIVRKTPRKPCKRERSFSPETHSPGNPRSLRKVPRHVPSRPNFGVPVVPATQRFTSSSECTIICDDDNFLKVDRPVDLENQNAGNYLDGLSVINTKKIIVIASSYDNFISTLMCYDLSGINTKKTIVITYS